MAEENLLGRMQSLLSDPESMQQLSELAQMFRSGDTEGASSPPPQENASASSMPSDLPDMSALMKLGTMMQDSTPDKNAALLLALRPHLGARRQERTDKAVRMLRLWGMVQAARKSGMLDDLL